VADRRLAGAALVAEYADDLRHASRPRMKRAHCSGAARPAIAGKAPESGRFSGARGGGRYNSPLFALAHGTERINQIASTLAGLDARAAELRRYL
jgi:hypothetical protein